ncbi:predicted protein [Postia placenta Mad-698-R]|nr:predicted protein [Postia placenta Mad-698-R]
MGVVESVVALCVVGGATGIGFGIFKLVTSIQNAHSRGTIQRNPVMEELEQRITDEKAPLIAKSDTEDDEPNVTEEGTLIAIEDETQRAVEEWREQQTRQADEGWREMEEMRIAEDTPLIRVQEELAAAERLQKEAEDRARRAEDERQRAEEERLQAERQKILEMRIAEDTPLIRVQEELAAAERLQKEAEDRARRAEDERQRAEEERLQAERQKILADEAKAAAEEQRRRAEEDRQRSDAERKKANEEAQSAVAGKEKAEAARADAQRAAAEARAEMQKTKDALKKGIKPVIVPTREEYEATKKRLGYQEGLFHFAVAGVSGSGKSSLINAFRCFNNNSKDPRVAATGVVETTNEVTRYPDLNPANPFVWYDVPGAGTLKIPDWQYFNQQGMYIFDCVVVLMDNRFTETDIAILRNCALFQIPAYIVRSKSRQHIRNVIEDIVGEDSPISDAVRKEAHKRYVDQTKKTVDDNLREAKLPTKRVYMVDKAALVTIAKGEKPVRYIDELDLVYDLLQEASKRRINTSAFDGLLAAGAYVSSTMSSLANTLGESLADPGFTDSSSEAFFMSGGAAFY